MHRKQERFLEETTPTVVESRLAMSIEVDAPADEVLRGLFR